MNRLSKISISFLLIVFLWWLFFYEPEVEYGPGPLAPEKPIQASAAGIAPFNFHEFTITPKAKFQITARILSRKDYSRGRESDISPFDFVLGWGAMSDESIYGRISFSQRDRWFFWRTGNYPIPKRHIEQQCANMHMIPATDKIEDQMDEAIKGDLIKIDGYLVFVKSEGNWKWNSSLSRDDTGGGSCEIIWVENFQILHPVNKLSL